MKKRIEKFRAEKISLFVMSLTLAFVFCQTALAGNVVVNISGDGEIFDLNNIYPGYTKEQTVTIKNTNSEETVNVYLDFDVISGSSLADKIRLYVIRETDNKYRIGGANDHMSLKEAGKNSPLYLDRLNAGQDRKYKIKIRFASDTDNSYQNLKTKFDINFEATSRVTSEQEPEPLRAGYIIGDGAAPAEEIQEAKTTPIVEDEKKQQKEQKEQEEQPQIAGVENSNNEVGFFRSNWMWILGAVFGSGSFLFFFLKKISL